MVFSLQDAEAGTAQTDRQSTLQRELRAAEEPVVGRVQCPVCQNLQIKRVSSAFCTACGAPFEQPCPVCSATIPLRTAASSACESCGATLRACWECHRLYALTQLRCTNDYCPAVGVAWPSRLAGGGESWPCAAGSVRRNGRMSLATLHEARQQWQAGPFADEVFHGPINAEGIVLLVSRQGTILTFAEGGMPDNPAEALQLREARVDATITASPLLWDGRLWLATQQGNLLRLPLDTLKPETVGSFGHPIEFFVRFGDGWAFVDPEGTLRWSGKDGSVQGELVALSLAGNAAGALRWMPPVVIDATLFGLFSIDLDEGGARTFLISVRAGAEQCQTVWKSDEPAAWLLATDDALLALGDERGWRWDLPSLLRSRVSETPPSTFTFNGPLALPPTQTREGKLIGVTRRDGMLLSFWAAAENRASSHGQFGAGHVRTAPLGSNFHFIFAGPEYVYLNMNVISTKLLGRPNRWMSYANSRVFVSTSRPGGLYAFQLA